MAERLKWQPPTGVCLHSSRRGGDHRSHRSGSDAAKAGGAITESVFF